MPEKQGSTQLKLTPEQQEEVRRATGKLTDTLELSIMDARGAHCASIQIQVGNLIPTGASPRTIEGRQQKVHPAAPVTGLDSRGA